MKRRGKADGGPAKRQRHRTDSLNARKEPSVSVLTEQSSEQFERLKRDRDDALEQQAATAEVLKIISRSDFDLQAVLDTLVESAASLCKAEMANIWRPSEGGFRLAAGYAVAGQHEEGLKNKDFLQSITIKAGRGSIVGRTLVERQTVPVIDLQADPEYDLRDILRLGNYRTALGVPLLRDGMPVGVLFLARTRVDPFKEKEIALLETFADQAVIAIENARLLNELHQRTHDLTEALEQQTATGEILEFISGSMADTKPVFDAIVRNLLRLFGTRFAVVQLLHEGMIYLPAVGGDGAIENLASYYPRPLDETTAGGLTMINKQVFQMASVRDNPGAPEVLREYAREIGFNSFIFAPMLREDKVIGAVGVAREEAKSFSDKHVALIKAFADQAVIAIENTRLFNELRQRTDDLTESLDQQTATSEVLKVISRSTFDLDRVLYALADSAKRLCQSDQAYFYLLDGEVYRLSASCGFSPESESYLKQHTIRPGRNTLVARTAQQARIVHIDDVLTDAEYTYSEAQKLIGFRTLLGVPLVHEGSPIGVLSLSRLVAQPFSAKQIELASTFADQAVIAIKNVRLFEEVQRRTEELTESLAQQTATADVLKVISRSTFDLQPVLDTLTDSAAQLCEADIAAIIRQRGDASYWATSYGLPPDRSEFVKNVPITPGRATVAGRALQEGKTVHVADVLQDPQYAARDAQKVAGHRATLGVPLLREGTPIGVILLMRRSPKAFTDKQIELVETFADQAVIAIENVRLFEEVQARTRDLTELLQQQTATADVLKVISRSAFNLQAVLDALIETAAHLCRADQGSITRGIAEKFYRAATYGYSSELSNYIRDTPVRMDRSSVVGRALVDGRIVHIYDVRDDPDYTFVPGLELGDYRTAIGVPMLREGIPIGVLALTRKEVLPFTDKQIELITTFADQAAIAIENVRLFESVEARTKELAQSLEELRTAQDRLVQTEKLASLGQLTAGIAHEIKNPLNFVNNFSGVSVELIDELQETLSRVKADDKTRGEIAELTDTIRGNLDKIVQHGKRADSIVKNMLLHSREGSGEHRPIDINSVVEESLNLAYHGARAEKQGFNITLERSLDPAAGQVDVFPQEITRVLINLISNGFYAATKRKGLADADGYEPMLTAATKSFGDQVEIRIRDNGTGIPPEVKERIFNPFFTTKPVGEGTGLGLSISHDIIVKQHAGRIEVDSEPGEYTEFRIILPRTAASLAKSGART